MDVIRDRSAEMMTAASGFANYLATHLFHTVVGVLDHCSGIPTSLEDELIKLGPNEPQCTRER